MHPYPHTYLATAAGDPSAVVSVDSLHLPALQTTPPPEFDGPGGAWSPETLLCAALADCFVFTFRAVSRTAGLTWRHLDCRVEGTLERVERVSQFSSFTTFANLIVPAGTDVAAARRLLEQAEHGCLIAKSLRGSRTLEADVTARGI